MALGLEDVGVQRGERWLLREVSFAPRSGEVTCLVGANGAGKTTLLRVLAGLWAPSEGSASLDGQPLHERPRRELGRHIIYMPQSARVSFDFPVAEYVAMGRYVHTGRDARAPEVIARVMGETDIVSLQDRRVTQLSGGELQRVLLARCLATEAPCILMDEPTANLDVAHALELMTLWRRLAASGRTVVAAIHDLNATLRYADRVLVMHEGRVLGDGAPDAVLTPEMVSRAFGVRARRVSAGRSELLDFEPRAGEDP